MAIPVTSGEDSTRFCSPTPALETIDGVNGRFGYLSPYTHRGAISNARLLSCDHEQVVFHYRDRADDDIRKTATLSADEFLRRFLYHVLPHGFQRIRHYGLLASRKKQNGLSRCRQLLNARAPAPAKKTTAESVLALLDIDIERCPRCGEAGLQRELLLPVPATAPTVARTTTAPHDMS